MPTTRTRLAPTSFGDPDFDVTFDDRGLYRLTRRATRELLFASDNLLACEAFVAGWNLRGHERPS